MPFVSRFLARAATLTWALSVILSTTVPAAADGNIKDPRFTVYVAPVWEMSTGGDENAPPPNPTYVPVGYSKNQQTVDTLRVDYGMSWKIDSKLTFSYDHSNVGYALGRILTLTTSTGQPISFVSNSIYDYTDTIQLAYATGADVNVFVNWFNHQRSDVVGECLNQKQCPSLGPSLAAPNAPPAGQLVGNSLSINSHGYSAGFAYTVPYKYNGQNLLSVSAELQYYLRPANPPAANPVTGTASPAVTGGVPWIGSTVQFPYSVTLNIPLIPDKTLTPFINYTNLPVLYEDSAVPEAYRGMLWGVSKSFGKYVTLSYTNFNLQSCRCIERVPAPDNLRLAFGILKLGFSYSF